METTKFKKIISCFTIFSMLFIQNFSFIWNLQWAYNHSSQTSILNESWTMTGTSLFDSLSWANVTDDDMLDFQFEIADWTFDGVMVEIEYSTWSDVDWTLVYSWMHILTWWFIEIDNEHIFLSALWMWSEWFATWAHLDIDLFSSWYYMIWVTPWSWSSHLWYMHPDSMFYEFYFDHSWSWEVINIANMTTAMTQLAEVTDFVWSSLMSASSLTFHAQVNFDIDVPWVWLGIVTIPDWTTITDHNSGTLDLSQLSFSWITAESILSFNDVYLRWAMSFWMPNLNLDFSKPIKIWFPVWSYTWSTIEMEVKHHWDLYFWSGWLTHLSWATCNWWMASTWNNIATVSWGIAEIYTCSASEFWAFEENDDHWWNLSPEITQTWTISKITDSYYHLDWIRFNQSWAWIVHYWTWSSSWDLTQTWEITYWYLADWYFDFTSLSISDDYFFKIEFQAESWSWTETPIMLLKLWGIEVIDIVNIWSIIPQLWPVSSFSWNSINDATSITISAQVNFDIDIPNLWIAIVTMPYNTTLSDHSWNPINLADLSLWWLSTESLWLLTSLDYKWWFAYWMSWANLDFSKPVKIWIPVWTYTWEFIDIEVKHHGEISFGSGWLTATSWAECNSWIPNISSNIATVSWWVAEIYTCSASEFIAHDSTSLPATMSPEITSTWMIINITETWASLANIDFNQAGTWIVNYWTDSWNLSSSWIIDQSWNFEFLWLNSWTTYYYLISFTDLTWSWASSMIYNFTTLVPPEIAPQIINAWNIVQITESWALLTWVTYNQIWSWVVHFWTSSSSLVNSWSIIWWEFEFIWLNEHTHYFYKISFTNEAWSWTESMIFDFETPFWAWPLIDETYDLPIVFKLSNDWESGQSWTITFTLTNEFPTEFSEDITWIYEMRIWLDKDFDFDIWNVEILNYSWAISWIECIGLDEMESIKEKIIICNQTWDFDLLSWEKLSFKLTWITNPSSPWKYMANIMLMTTHEEFFRWEIDIKNTWDTSYPVIDTIEVIDPYNLVVIFSEPISLQYTSAWTPSIFTSISPDLNVNSFWDDHESHKKLFIGTDAQTNGFSYEITINWIWDFSWNYAPPLTWSFVWFNTEDKMIDYVIPYKFAQWETNVPVDIYWMNWLFSLSAPSTSQINLWSWITINWSITKHDSNHISFHVDVWVNASIRSRDVSFTDSSNTYTAYWAIFIDKDFDNLVESFWIFTESFDAWNNSGQIKINFNDSITSAWTVSVEKTYSWWSDSWLSPQVSWTSYSWNDLFISFTNVESWNFYELSFDWLTFTNKLMDEYMKTWFDFFAPWWNFSDMIVPPIIIDSKPFDWSFDIPVKDPTNTWLTIEVFFDQDLQTATLTSDNIKLKKDWDNSSSIPWVISYTWANSIYKLTFITTAALENWLTYFLELSWNIKSDKSMWLVWNAEQWNGHNIYFTTMPDYSNIVSWGWGGWSVTYTQPFYIQNNVPFYWASDVPKDAKMQIVFNEIIDTSTVDENVSLDEINSAWEIISNVWGLSISYNDDYSPTTIFIDAWTLNESSNYRLTLNNGSWWIQSVKQQNLDWWDFILEFTTWQGLASAVDFDIVWDYNEPDLSRIEIWFSSPIDESTITLQNINLFSNWWSKETIWVNYNFEWNYVVIKPANKLSENTDYTLILKSTITDLAWNTINTWNLVNWFVENWSNVEKQFTTWNSSTFISNVWVEDFYATSDKIELWFSWDIENWTSKSTYTIKECINFNHSTSGNPETYCNSNWTTISLDSATIKYDDDEYGVSIENLSISSSDTWKETIVEVTLNNIEDSYWNALWTWIWQNQFHFPVFSEEVQNEFIGDNQGMAMSAHVSPQNNMAWEQTLYFIDFPIQKSLSAWETVLVKFPKQFDLSSASLDSSSPVNFINWDTNWTAKFSSVTKHSEKNALVYTVNNWYTLQDNDFIISDITWIINPTQPKDFSTDGYVVEISTYNSNDVMLDKLNSNPIFIKAAPTWDSAKTITIQMKDAANDSAINTANMVMHLHSPDWYSELLTDSNGQIIYTWSVNEYYWLSIDPFVMINTNWSYSESDYVSEGKFYDIYLSSNKTIDVMLKNTTTSNDLIEISWSISGLVWEEVRVWFASQVWYFERDLNDWNAITTSPYSYTIKVPKDAWFSSLWIMPLMKHDFASGWSYEMPDWQPPRPIDINVEESDISWMNFSIATPDNNLTIIVQDETGLAIANAHVYTYSPSWDTMWLYWDTDTSWEKTFKVWRWVYTYWAYIEWLPPISEKTISIETDNSDYSVTLEVAVPDLTIKWTVLNWSDPVSSVGIYAYNEWDWNFANTMTDSNWDYTLYVDDWTWKVWWWVESFGPLEEQTFTVNWSSLTDKNFTIDSSSIFAVAWSVNLASWTWVDWANIFAESTDWDYTKWWFAFSDDEWDFTLNLKEWSYEVFSYHPEYWEIWKKFVSIDSSGNISTWDLDFVIATPRSIEFTFAWAVPSDLANFEWMIDVFDISNWKWFAKNINWVSTYSFDKVPDWTYELRIMVKWIWEVYSSWSFVVTWDMSKTITLAWDNVLYEISWTVTDLDNYAVQDAFVEIVDLDTNESIWASTSDTWTFVTNVKPWDYEIIIKKPWYKNSKIKIMWLNSDHNWINKKLSKIDTSQWISYEWNVVWTAWTTLSDAFVNLQWVRNDWTVTDLWLWIEVSGSWFIIENIPKNKRWKAIFVADGYEAQEIDLWLLEVNTTQSTVTLVELSNYTVVQPKFTPITPQQGWTINDSNSNMKVTIPASALWNWSNAGSVSTKETTNTPKIAGQAPVWWKAKEISATDSNQTPINDLNSDINIEFDYTAEDFYNTNTWITVEELRNSKLSYYDETSKSWIALTTTMTSSWFTCNWDSDLDTITWTSLVSTCDTISWAIITLKTTSDKLWLFAPIVSDLNESEKPASMSGWFIWASITAINSSTMAWNDAIIVEDNKDDILASLDVLSWSNIWSNIWTLANLSWTASLTVSKKTVDFSTSTWLTQPALFIPTDSTESWADSLLLGLPAWITFDAGLEISPPVIFTDDEETAFGTALEAWDSTKDFSVKWSIDIPTNLTNESVDFWWEYLDICMSAWWITDPDDMDVYYSVDEWDSWLEDTEITWKTIDSDSDTFCFKTDHLTSFGAATSSTTTTTTTTTTTSTSTSWGWSSGWWTITSISNKTISPTAKRDFETIDNIDFKNITWEVPVTITMNHTSWNYWATIQKWTVITFSNWEKFDWKIEAPKRVSNTSVAKMTWWKTALRALKIWSDDWKSINFSKPVELKLSTNWLSSKINRSDIFLYSYNETKKKYEMETWKRMVDKENEIITVEVTHMTTFVLATWSLPLSSLINEESGVYDPNAVFQDISNHWAKNYIETLYDRWVLSDKENYYPNDNLNRAELIKIVIETFGHWTSDDYSKINFDDVDNNAWYAPYLAKSVDLWIVDAPNSKLVYKYVKWAWDYQNAQKALALLWYDVDITWEASEQTTSALISYQKSKGLENPVWNLWTWTAIWLNSEDILKDAVFKSLYSKNDFRPWDSVNRAEAMKIILKWAWIEIQAWNSTFSDIDSNAWFAKYVNTAAYHWIVSWYWDWKFGPLNSITRWEIAKVAIKALDALETKWALILNQN